MNEQEKLNWVAKIDEKIKFLPYSKEKELI